MVKKQISPEDRKTQLFIGATIVELFGTHSEKSNQALSRLTALLTREPQWGGTVSAIIFKEIVKSKEDPEMHEYIVQRGIEALAHPLIREHVPLVCLSALGDIKKRDLARKILLHEEISPYVENRLNSFAKHPKLRRQVLRLANDLGIYLSSERRPPKSKKNRRKPSSPKRQKRKRFI